MLASILVLAVLLHVGHLDGRWRRRDAGVLLLLLAGLALTVSKTMVCLVAGLAVLLGVALSKTGSRRVRWAATAVWVTVALGFATATHIVPVRDSTVGEFRDAQIVAGAPLTRVRWSSESWVLMPTTYVFNNYASWRAATQTWPWGVGPGGHNGFVESLRRRREYPQSIGFTDPHSTYFGAAAELGTAGLVALVLLLSTVGLTIIRLARDASMPRWVAASYAGAGAAFLVEAVATDLMNCRHYWWLIAVVASWDACARREPREAEDST